MLYFFRGLKSHVGRNYRPDIREGDKWEASALKDVADSLRGIPLGYFADGTAKLEYQRSAGAPATISKWAISVYRTNRRIAPNKPLKRALTQWTDEWESDKKALGETRSVGQIFIPTERSVFTRLAAREPSVLYAEYQPLQFREFASVLDKAYKMFHHIAKLRRAGHLKAPAVNSTVVALEFLLNSQHEALSGEAYVPSHGPQEWKWRPGREGQVVLPIEATSSGQMEAWPFFAIAATFGVLSKGLDFYFEEPETHLHPAAQVEVMRTIAFLVNLGHRFVVTTHSPYVLYLLNNLIQTHLSYGGDVPEGTLAMDPEKVCAFRLGKDQGEILDRAETSLVDASELEKVADELGGDFDRLMDLMEERR
jgi:hypothetical protein